jgi:hypothetical protein
LTAPAILATSATRSGTESPDRAGEVGQRFALRTRSITTKRRPSGVPPGVEDAHDVGVVHARQEAALVGEAGDQVGGLEARLEHLDRDLTLDRGVLARAVDGPVPALTDPFEDLVRTDRLRHRLVGPAAGG